jgi:hypothetical protein
MFPRERFWQSVPPARVKTYAAPTILNSVALAGQVRAMLATRPGPGEDPLVRRAWWAAVAWLDSSALGTGDGAAEAPLLLRWLHRLTMPWPGLRAGHGVIAIQGRVSTAKLLWPALIGFPALLVAVEMGVTVPDAVLAT